MIENASFETSVVGQPGAPLGWSVNHASALEETAEFVGDVPTTLVGRETFDEGWSSTASQVRITALVDALVEKLEAERFETFFANQGFIYLTALAAFAFNEETLTVETFEVYDVVDSDFALASSEIERAMFGESRTDTFDSDWGSSAFALEGVATAIFDIAGIGENAEPAMSEAFKLRLPVRVRSSIHDNRLIADVEGSPQLTVAINDAVSFVVDEGALPAPLETNRPYAVRDTSDNWFTVSPHAGADTIDLTADGFGAVYVLPDPGRFWVDEL